MIMNENPNNTDREGASRGFDINVKTFVGSIAVIALLMVVTFILTKCIPAGEFTRIVDAAGNTVIDYSVPFRYVEGGISVWKWLASPILVLGSNGSALLIAVIFFLLIIGGIFFCMEACGMMKYLMNKLIFIFAGKKYRLLASLIFFFMLLGAFVGSFEEVIPLVPIVVGLSVGLGWDVLTGMGMSLLAVGCGFASGVCNPFTVGVAQTLAGLPMFSGISLRLLSFVLIYGLLLAFVAIHAKKVEKERLIHGDTVEDRRFLTDRKLERASICFGGTLGAGILLVLISGVVPALQDYTLVIMALAFLIGGIVATVQTGFSFRNFMKFFGKGVKSMLPAVLMILMASSIKYTLEEAKVLDTVLYMAVDIAETMPRWAVVLFIYLIVLVMNFFVSSGSAKAFMLIPIIIPLAQIFGVSAQLCILAFAFGDGFSNVFYPTNAGLLVSLSLSKVSYGSWFKYSWPFQLMNLLLTCGILLLGLATGY